MARKNKTMRQLFEEKVKLVRRTNSIGVELDKKIRNKWGFHYSETYDDPCIDTLDYGTGGMGFDNFVERMNEYKKDFDKGEGFKAIP